MNKTIKVLLEVINTTEGLCEPEFRECEHTLKYINKTGILDDKPLFIPNDEESGKIINNVLLKLEKDCKFGVRNKTGENNARIQ